MPQYRQDKIRFSDGRLGVQYVTVHDDGQEELTGIVVTRRADGRRCEIVYDQHADASCGVHELYRIQGEWEIDRR